MRCLLQVDGYLFLHRECGYAAGVTPLAGWLKKEMVQDMLLQEDKNTDNKV